MSAQTANHNLELLEREGALRDLDAALADAAAGHGRVVFMSGEAGIGKTSLIEQFTSSHRATHRVLWGSCDALFTPRPLGPLHDIATQTQGDLLALLATEAKRTTLFSAFLHELSRSLDNPSIVVFEDIHWADEATLDLLTFVGRRIQRIPSLLALTYRDDEVGPQHLLRIMLGDLATSPAARRIELRPLSERAVRRLIGDRTLDPAALYHQTGGNPFFVTETIASGASGIPSTVRDAVLARAARLSISARAVLEAAAVIGPRIEPSLLAEVVGAEVIAVDECIAMGMLNASGEALAFRHELARQTIHEAILPHHKLVLHRLALAALKASPATSTDLARLAYHAESAGDGEAVRAFAPAAARQAAAVSAHREARAQYARALRFAHGLAHDQHAYLLEAYAQECNITEQRPEGIAARRRALEIWRALGNPLKQGENLALLMVMHFGLGQTVEAERSSKMAIELLEALPPSRELALAYRTQASLRMFNRDVHEAVAWGEKAIALAERFNDSETLAGAYNAIGSAQIIADYARGRAALERSLVIAQEKSLTAHIANAYTNLGSASGEVYQFLQADHDLADGIAFCIDHDLDVSRLYMQSWHALVHLYLGRWDQAAETAALVLRHPGVSAISRIMALVALGRLRARRGDPGATEALDEALELARQTGQLQRLAPVHMARAERAWLAGELAPMRLEVQAIYELALSKRHPWFAGELALWGWRAGEPISAPSWVAPPFLLQIEGSCRRAADEWERLGCPYEQAMALIDGDRAAQLQALDIFDRLGARPAAEIVRQRRHTIPQRQIEKEAFGGLTEREREVAALIAQGKSNREIAQTLTVGVKTIETYVTRILGKLDFDSRVQIATWAVEKNLKTRNEWS